jgi:mono/diheme cytochrome c family protein/uncharacterized cupredoxin-like copper-binding protein
MNTGKQINAMVVVLFLTLIAVGAYTIWDPFRSESAEDEQFEKSANFGAELFALNCRLCHGDRGEGGGPGGRLAAAALLDRADLAGIDDGGVFTQAKFDSSFRLVTNTIMCGRAGTSMPTWGASQGGTLNDEQIRQLAILITGGEPTLGIYRGEGFWELAQHHADELDAEATEHAHIDMAGGFPAGATELIVSNAGPFTLGQYIRIGEERLRVLPKQLEVERAVEGTEAAEHDRGTQLLRDGAPVVRSPKAILQGGILSLEQGAAETLAEPIDDEATSLPVGSTEGFAVGDVLQIEDERVRVTGISAGLPSTGLVLAEEIGREPKRFVVSGAGLETGAIIRVGGELMEVRNVRDDGDAGIELDEDATASASAISVSDPVFLREGYLLRIGDERLEVVAPVETGQLLDETVGRAQTSLAVTGTLGIEEGMVIRLDSELLRVVDIIRPASIEVERGANDTAASVHDAGDAILRFVPPEEGEEPPAQEELATGQSLLEPVSADATSFVISGTQRLTVGDSYLIDSEVVEVTGVQPALLRVERAVDGSDRAAHSRRAPLYVRNQIAVERGVSGTAAAAHDAEAEVFFTEVEVKRAVEGSKPLEHGKNAEIFLGNGLVVARGVLGTDPADHENGELVRNFPTAPDEPARTGDTCGQLALQTAPTPAGPAGPTPTPIAGATQVDTALDEFSIEADPASAPAGGVEFRVDNTGSAGHNFRVIRTDLAPDALPQANNRVVEADLDVVGGFTDLLDAGGQTSVSLALDAGAYVLICNVPLHYEQGMYLGFEVTTP